MPIGKDFLVYGGIVIALLSVLGMDTAENLIGSAIRFF